MFAIDQQQYLQGYLPVVFLTSQATSTRSAAASRSSPGPGFVDQGERRDDRAAGAGRHALRASPPGPHVRPAGRHRRSRMHSRPWPAGARPPASRSSTSAWRRSASLARLLRRPEFGALLGAIAVASSSASRRTVFGTLGGAANWTDVASTLGIMAVVVALLMIGGEFDLSAGVMTGTAGLLIGLLTTEGGLTHVARDRAHDAFAAGDRLPQRLHGHEDQAAELHRHAGDLLHPPRRQPRRHQGDHRHRPRRRPRRAPATTARRRSSPARSGRRTTSASPSSGGSRSRALATWVLARTRVGNWIFAVGGDANAARNVGVPVARVKIGLFMTTVDRRGARRAS